MTLSQTNSFIFETSILDAKYLDLAPGANLICESVLSVL